MPYINNSDKARVDAHAPQCSGELNYAITRLISAYAARFGNTYTYTTLNDVLGALEGAKLEFVRRVVVPYEDRKRAENGDVYDSAILIE